jgi:hypothetical protein
MGKKNMQMDWDNMYYLDGVRGCSISVHDGRFQAS